MDLIEFMELPGVKVDYRVRAAVAAGHPEWVKLPRSRQLAFAMGAKSYFTGKPLSCGHFGVRSIPNAGRCADCRTHMRGAKTSIEHPPSVVEAANAFGHPEWLKIPRLHEVARDEGSNKYYPGNACRRGHVAPKYVSTGGCVACAMIKAGSLVVGSA